MDLTQHGIPSHAHIISINFTAEGGDVFPLFISHSNDLSPLSKIPLKLSLYGRPLRFNGLPEKGIHVYTKINVAVIYSTHSENDFGFDKLYSALQSFLQEDYGLMGLDAHIVVEDILNKVIQKFEEKLGISKLRLKYKENLLIRLKEICKYFKFSCLDDKSIKLLIKLYNKVRNQRAHEPFTVKLTKDQAAEFLCVTIFSARYFMELQRRIISG